MATVDADGSSLHQRTHSPSWLAWSECWRPTGVQSAFIKLHRVNSRNIWFYNDDSIINIIMLLLVLSPHSMQTLVIYCLWPPYGIGQAPYGIGQAPYGIGHAIIFSCCGFFLSSIYVFFLA